MVGAGNGQDRGGRGRGFRRTAALIEAPVKTASESRGFAVSRLLTHWDEIAGAEMARLARPVDVKYGRGSFGATLTLLVKGADAPVVEMGKEALRERVNACYGYAAISRIRLTQTAPSGFAEPAAEFKAKPAVAEPGPEAVSAARERTEDIGDPDLRAALEKLGARIISGKDRSRR